MQPTIHWLPDAERYLGPHVFPEQSMTPNLPMDTSLPTLGTHVVNQIQKISSCSVISSCEVSLGPVMPSNKYVNKHVHPKPPNKQLKERTVFSKEKKAPPPRAY